MSTTPPTRSDADLVEVASAQWAARYPAREGFRALAAIVRTYDAALKAVEARLRPMGLTLSRVEALLVLAFSRQPSMPVMRLRDLLMILGHDRATLVGHSLGGGVAMQCAIRHPDKVRKVVVISSTFRRDGMIKEAVELLPTLTADHFKGSPIEAEYKKLSPTPDQFPKFVKRVLATATTKDDISADKLKATPAPMFFIHGDADGIRLEHVAEMFRLKGGGTHGDMGPRSASRLAILPDATHVTLMQRMTTIVPMVNDFLDAKP